MSPSKTPEENAVPAEIDKAQLSALGSSVGQSATPSGHWSDRLVGTIAKGQGVIWARFKEAQSLWDLNEKENEEIKPLTA